MRTYYDLKKALKNPKSPQDVCIFLDKEEPALLEQLHTLVNLKELSLLDSVNLKELPTSILQLTQLEHLRIRRTGITELPEGIGQLTGLQELILEDLPIQGFPESIGQLKNLVHLKTRTTFIKKLPASLAKLKKLETLEFWDSKLETLPENIGDLKGLKKLKIISPDFKELPESFGKLKQLELLYLRHTHLKALPDSFSNLVELKYLDCVGSELSCLPSSFGQLKKLMSIQMEDNQFKVFPKEICACTKLGIVNFDNNELTTLPEALGQLIELRTLSLQDNAFKSLPYILLDWGKTFGFKHRWGFNINPALYYETKIFDLLNKKAFKVLSREEKISYFKLYTNHKTEMTTVNRSVIREALNAKVTTVADHALNHLTEGTAATLHKNAEILIWGKTSKDKVDLNQQIEACGLKVVTKLSENTTHVLVSSRGNKKLDRLPETAYWNWVTETQLISYLEQLQPSFLVESSSNNESIDQVEHLIMTLNEENMMLALELITGGGLPKELLTEVFIAYKLSTNATTRKKAQKLLKQKASIELQQVLRRRTNVRQNKGYYFNEDYEALKDKLKSYTENTPIDFGKLAFAVAMCSRYGYAMALNSAPLVYCKRLLEEILIGNNDTFDLSYNEKFETFPTALVSFPRLKKIKIDALRGVWDENGGWKTNSSFEIPETIAELTNLEELKIIGVTLETFPIEAIGQLKNLKILVVKLNKSIDIGRIKEQLPNCQMDLQ